MYCFSKSAMYDASRATYYYCVNNFDVWSTSWLTCVGFLFYFCNKQWMHCRYWIDTGKKWYKWVHKRMTQRFSIFTILICPGIKYLRIVSLLYLFLKPSFFKTQIIKYFYGFSPQICKKFFNFSTDSFPYILMINKEHNKCCQTHKTRRNKIEVVHVDIMWISVDVFMPKHFNNHSVKNWTNSKDPNIDDSRWQGSQGSALNFLKFLDFEKKAETWRSLDFFMFEPPTRKFTKII